MDKISGLNNIVEILQSQASRKKAKAGQKSPSQSSRSRLSVNKPGTEELENNIKSKIKELDASATDFQNKANTIVIENILFWEFGDEIQNDPEFISLKDKIYTAISDNRSLNSDFDRLISNMLQK